MARELLFAFLLLFLFVRPVLKYIEYVHGVLRVNFSVVFFLIAVSYLFIKYVVNRGSLQKIKKGTLVIGSVLLYILFVQLIQIPIIIHQCEECVRPLAVTLSSTFFGYILFFFLGFEIFSIMRRKRNQVMILISWFVFLVIVLVNTVSSSKGFMLNLEGEMIYLMLADSFALLSLLALVVVRRSYVSFLLFVLSSLVLFLLLSRTSLYLFVIAGGLLLFRKYPLASVLLLLFLITTLVFYFEINFDTIKNNRMLRFLLTGKDASWSQRGELLSEGIVHLKENWLFGEYLWEVKSSQGKTGGYIHNFLSVMNQFGFLPFFFLILTGVIIYLNAVVQFFKSRRSEALLFFSLTTFVFLSIAISRSYQVAYMWLPFTMSYTYFKFKRIDVSK